MNASHDVLAALLAAWLADIEDTPPPAMPVLAATLALWSEVSIWCLQHHTTFR
jgi:hypothetical protein